MTVWCTEEIKTRFDQQSAMPFKSISSLKQKKVWARNHLCHSNQPVLSIAGIIVKLKTCYLALKILILHYCAIINTHYWKVNEGRFIMSVINTNGSFRGWVTTKFHQSTRWFSWWRHQMETFSALLAIPKTDNYILIPLRYHLCGFMII